MTIALCISIGINLVVAIYLGVANVVIRSVRNQQERLQTDVQVTSARLVAAQEEAERLRLVIQAVREALPSQNPGKTLNDAINQVVQLRQE